MSDENIKKALEDDAREQDAAEPGTADYTGDPCQVCGRIRVFVRKDGQRQCEKCDSIQTQNDEAT